MKYNKKRKQKKTKKKTRKSVAKASVLGQIGDVKAAERYFQDAEEACQMNGSQPAHTTCVLMNRYVRAAAAELPPLGAFSTSFPLLSRRAN